MTHAQRTATFLVGATGLCIVSRYAGDPTWDIPVSLIMATAAFLTAPWAVRTIFSRRSTRRAWCLALAAWYLSTSASYDLYLFLRDGVYHWEYTLGNAVA